MSGWIDITRPIDETLATWPGRSRPRLRWEKSLQNGDHCNVSSWELSAHSGTHLDAPLHFVSGGKSIDELPLDTFVGECVVVDWRTTDFVALEEELIEESKTRQVKRLLIRTQHSDSLGSDYPTHERLMSLALAADLIARGLVLIGADRLSVDDSRGEEYRLHRLFLESNCAILEGLHLADVPPGRYELFAVPLRVVGGEASPVRALLRLLSTGKITASNYGFM